MSLTRPELSAEDIRAALNRQGVRYIFIGAFAAIAQGAPIDPTYAIDVTPQRDPENMERLSLALAELDDRPVGRPAVDGAQHMHGVCPEGVSLTAPVSHPD
jgi:hypothetical protein